MKKTVVVLSGGMDSATVLYHLLDLGHEVKALAINYGQRHVRELDAAAELARRADVEFRLADLTAINALLGENALSSSKVDVPLGHYAEESMKATVVPNRNMLFMSLAIAWAISQKFDAVAYGAHSGDHAIYPDCRPEFAKAMAHAASLCDWRSIELLRPFVDMDKGDIARRGHELGVPFEVTYTCYNGQPAHCGKCGSCTERKEAFQKFGLHDPTTYQA